MLVNIDPGGTFLGPRLSGRSLLPREAAGARGRIRTEYVYAASGMLSIENFSSPQKQCQEEKSVHFWRTFSHMQNEKIPAPPEQSGGSRTKSACALLYMPTVSLNMCLIGMPLVETDGWELHPRKCAIRSCARKTYIRSNSPDRPFRWFWKFAFRECARMCAKNAATSLPDYFFVKNKNFC